jgi:5-methylthioribose kinase
MAYRDLDVEKAKEYVLERTDLFGGTGPAGLNVRELVRSEIDGDGYVNYIYRIWDDKGNSVILKQAKPFLKAFGKGVYPVPVDRSASEADIMKIRSAIVPQFVPRTLHVDKENNLYICEDCGRLGIMRFGLSRGRRYPLFPKLMGEFIAKCNFYTSEIFVDQCVHKELGVRFTSPDMSLIMESILFRRKNVFANVDNSGGEPDSLHKAASDFFWSRREVRLELMKLRDVYMKKQECLVHGDLHTSNTMIEGSEMKILDMEYTHMGPFSSDSGYLLGNLVYTYDTWFYHEEWNSEERALYREEILGYIKDTLNEYFRVFTECWVRDAKDEFKEYPEYLEALFLTYLREVCGFMGSQICSRIGGYAETPDFDVLTDTLARNKARAMAMTTAYNLIMRGNGVSSAEDITDIIKNTAVFFLEETGDTGLW